jgi:hypothetical protein
LSQAQGLCKKYPDALELWKEFFAFMWTQTEKGASAEYCLESFRTLETVWESHKGENENAIS